MAEPITAAPSLDDLRGLTIALLDKCFQVERLLEPYHHLAGIDDALASTRAYRATMRGYLSRIRDLERGPPAPAASQGAKTTPHDHPHTRGQD